MIKYRKGYKYQLADTYIRKIDIYDYTINTEFISLTPKGILTIKKAYSFDGASGLTIDTNNSMEASLVHDSLYEIMRKGLLPQDCRDYVDKLFREVCITKGMWGWRANIWYYSVDKFAAFAAAPKNKKEVFIIK